MSIHPILNNQMRPFIQPLNAVMHPDIQPSYQPVIQPCPSNQSFNQVHPASHLTMSIHLVIQPCSIHPSNLSIQPASHPITFHLSIHPIIHPVIQPYPSIQPAIQPCPSSQPINQPYPASQPASQPVIQPCPSINRASHPTISIHPVIKPYPSIHPVSDDQPCPSAQSTNKTANCASPKTVFITLAGGRELSSGVSVYFLFVLSCRTSWQPSVTNYKRMRRDCAPRAFWERH